MIQINRPINVTNTPSLSINKAGKTNFKGNKSQLDTIELSTKTKIERNLPAILITAAVAVVGAVMLVRKHKLNGVKNVITNTVDNAKNESVNIVDKTEKDIEQAALNAQREVPAFSLKTAKECITQLFGEIPTETEQLKKFVKTPTEFDYMPLNAAAHYGDNKLVEKFLANGADINYAGVCDWTALHEATMNGHIKTVKLLLKNGADINAISEKSVKEANFKYYGRDMNVIDLAAANGHNDLINFFISKGLDVKKVNGHKATPLILAAENGHTKTVNLLLKKGLNIDAVDCGLQTALHRAARNGHKATVELLLKKGANASLKCDCGRIPLIHAADNGHNDIIDILIKHGSDINSRDEIGQTALHWTAGLNHNIKTVEYLLKKGADINLLSNSKLTALDEAIQFKRADIIGLLRSKGAKTAQEIADSAQ